MLADAHIVTWRKDSQDKTADVLEVVVFDDTIETMLCVWDALMDSVALWRPSVTVLLVTNPGWKDGGKKNLSINPNTYVDVDPNMYDADWLRNHAQNIAKRNHVNPPFPREGKYETYVIQAVC